MNMTETQERRHIKCLRMLAEGPATGEAPATFAHRLTETVGQDVYEMVMERIRTGRYPSTDAPNFPDWSRGAIDCLSRGQEPLGVIRYACGWPLATGGTCPLARGHNGSHHPERY